MVGAIGYDDRMNRNHLAIFHAVTRCGSFTAAAADMLISQPALSMQVRELEKRLGVELLERLPRGVKLTAAGEILFGYADRIQALEASAVQAMKDVRSLKRGSLALGCSLTIGTYLLPPLLARFNAKYPGIRVQVQIANTADIQQQIIDGVLDIGLTEGFVEDPALDGVIFRYDQLVAVSAAGHPLTQQRNITLKQYLCFPLILREKGSGTRAVLERAATTVGLSLEPIMELASPEAIKAMVMANNGVAVMSRLAVEAELKAGSLVAIPLTDCKLHRPLHRVVRRDRQISQTLKAFLALLHSSAGPVRAAKS